MAEAVRAWLAALARRGASVLAGDPRRTYLALDRLECVIEHCVAVTRELEDSEIKRTGVFRFRWLPLRIRPMQEFAARFDNEST